MPDNSESSSLCPADHNCIKYINSLQLELLLTLPQYYTFFQVTPSFLGFDTRIFVISSVQKSSTKIDTNSALRLKLITILLIFLKCGLMNDHSLGKRMYFSLKLLALAFATVRFPWSALYLRQTLKQFLVRPQMLVTPVVAQHVEVHVMLVETSGALVRFRSEKYTSTQIPFGALYCCQLVVDPEMQARGAQQQQFDATKRINTKIILILALFLEVL